MDAMGRYLTANDWNIFNWDGKLKNAPSSMKHLFHGLGAGLYVFRDTPSDKTIYPMPEAEAHEQIEAAFYTVLYNELLAVSSIYSRGPEGVIRYHEPRDYDPVKDSGYKYVQAQTAYGMYVIDDYGTYGPYADMDRLIIEGAIRHGFLAPGALSLLAPASAPAPTAPTAPALTTNGASSTGHDLAQLRMQALAPELFALVGRIAADPAVPRGLAQQAQQYINWVYMRNN